MSRLSAFKASQPRDIIYSVLSLANDTIQSAKEDMLQSVPLPPLQESQLTGENTRLALRVAHVMRENRATKLFPIDYENDTFFDVSREFMSFVIRHSKSLDILCRPWAPEEKELPFTEREHLPSWVCQQDRAPFKEDRYGTFVRVNADSLVGEVDAPRHSYNAAAKTKPTWSIGPSANPRSLFVTGFIIDEITELTAPAVEGNVPPLWAEFAGWQDTSLDPPESFWRTIVANRDSNGRVPPSYFRRACRHVFDMRAKGASVNVDRLMTQESSQVIRGFLERVQAVIFMRSLIKTRERKVSLGLAPTYAQKGDVVCVLRGCSVPVVVRLLSAVSQDRSMADHHPKISGSLGEPPSLRPPQQTGKTVSKASQPTVSSSVGVVDGVEDHADPLRPTVLGKRTRDLSPPLRSPIEPHSPGGIRKIDPFGKMPVEKCQLIGECYLHGMMDGEIFQARDDSDVNEICFQFD